MFLDSDYENSPCIGYGDEGATFVRVCPKCGRFVKTDDVVTFHDDGPPKEQPNATCKKCGRIEMPFLGFL
jgi:hypothetical protein